MRHRAALLVLALTAGILSGCGGGNDTGAYCDSLKNDKQAIATLASGSSDIGKLDDAFAEIHKLAGEAPDSVAEDWKTLDGVASSVTDAMNQAGITFGDLAKLRAGKIPKGLDQAKLAALAQKVSALNTDDVAKASNDIRKHAKDECGVDLTQ